jgi:hypothetical protein
MPGTSGGGDSAQLKEHQQPGKQEVLAQQQMHAMQRIEETLGSHQPLIHQLLHYQQQLNENQKMHRDIKQQYEQQMRKLNSMETSLRGQQLRHDQQQKLVEEKTLCQQLFNDLQSVEKQRGELSHGFIMLGGISEQQQLLKYAQYLLENGRKLKQRYELELKRFRSMELSCSVQKFDLGQQQLLQGQKAVYQQLWNDWQVALKRHKELQPMLRGEDGLQMSYGHQQKEIVQGQQLVPVGHYQQNQGVRMILNQSGQLVPIGPAQPQHGQHDPLIHQPPQHILQGAENTRWSGVDQQQGRKLAPLDSQQKLVLDKQQKEIEEEKIGFEQQTASHQQQNIEQLHKQEEWTMLQMPQDPGGHDQQPRDKQQQRMEQLKGLQEKLNLIMQQQREEGGQQPNHDQQKQNEQEILHQQIRSLEQQILQQQREDDHRDQRNQQLQHSGELQQQPPHHQAEDSQQLSNDQKGQYEAEDQGTIEQQEQRQTKNESQQPINDQYLLSYSIEDMQNIRGLRQMWERISQEQDNLQQVQRYRLKFKQRQKKEEQPNNSKQKGQGDKSDGITCILCICGTAFNPNANLCANPSCGKPRPRNQPQGPPCVYCHRPLIKEGALQCGSCNKKQPEIPAKQGPGGTGIPPPPGLEQGYGYSNPPQPGRVQLSSAIVAGPTTLPYTTPVFRKMATTTSSFVLVHQPIQGHPGNLSAAGNKPFVMIQPNVQQPLSTHAPQGSPRPATGISGANLPSNQGNDSGEKQAVIGPGVPDSAWSTKDCSTNGQHSVNGAYGNNFSSASTCQKVLIDAGLGMMWGEPELGINVHVCSELYLRVMLFTFIFRP